MTRYTRLLVAAALTATLGSGFAACAKKAPAPAPAPPPPAETPAPTPPPPPPPPPPAPAPKPPTEEEIFAKKTLDELNKERPLGDVFFAYDSSELSDEARTSLQKNADWMKRWTSTAVTVEGHCDSRGSSEYNLALGERRAASVRSYLASLGVDGSRVQAVSKGEEQPVCGEENESCWSQNRRGHFVITAK